MSAAYVEGMHEELSLHGVGMFYLVHHTHIDLLPEAGNGRHTGGMLFAHGLLHL